MISTDQKNIIFFDGVCILCNGFTDRVYRADKKKVFYFAPLQGKTAGQALARMDPPLCEDDRNGEGYSTIIYYRDGAFLTESEAVLEIAKDLGGIHASLYYLTCWIPRILRDAVYRLVAKYRYKVLGKRDACRLASLDRRILD